MEHNNLGAQSGSGNNQDNSVGKTESSHSTNITVHGLGEAAIFGLVIMAVLVVAVLMMWQPWELKGPAVSPGAREAVAPAAPAPQVSAAPPPQSQPGIELRAETGLYAGGRFTPAGTFKAGQLISVRLTVSRACYARVTYFQEEGDPVMVYPQENEPPVKLPAGAEVLIPDPEKLRRGAQDSTVLKLENAKDHAIRESLFIQVSEAPFDFNGSSIVDGTRFRTYGSVAMADMRTRGVRRLQGAEAASAQSAQDVAANESQLTITINP